MASSSSTVSSGFFHNLFTPLPVSDAEERKDHLDHIAAYADTAGGAWDAFRGLEYITSWFQKIPSLANSAPLGKVCEVVNTAGIGLSIPAIISDCNNLRNSASNIKDTRNLPYSDPLRTRKITQAVKKVFLDLMSLVNDTSQAALFAERVKIAVINARNLRITDGIYNATSALLDSFECIGECFKLKHYYSPAAERSKLREKKNLSWMIIVKDVASIGGSALALVAIVFGTATLNIAVVATAGLACSTVWLTMKLTSHFYNKIVVERPPASAMS